MTAHRHLHWKVATWVVESIRCWTVQLNTADHFYWTRVHRHIQQWYIQVDCHGLHIENLDGAYLLLLEERKHHLVKKLSWCHSQSIFHFMNIKFVCWTFDQYAHCEIVNLSLTFLPCPSFNERPHSRKFLESLAVDGLDHLKGIFEAIKADIESSWQKYLFSSS